MPVPKKRRSKAKKRTKGACWKIEMPNLRPCPSCGVNIASHQACPACGQYKGRQVVSIKAEKTQEEE